MKNFAKAFFLIFIITILFSCNNTQIIEPIKTQYTIKFYVWNNTQNKYIKSSQLVEEGTLFGSIIKPETPSFTKEGNNYSFKHWTLISTDDNELMIDGEKFPRDTPITTNITLYAVYKIKEKENAYTFTFMRYYGEKTGYVEIIGGKIISGGIIPPTYTPYVQDHYKVGDDGQDEVVYVFDHWTKEEPDGLNIKTSGAPFEIENEQITKTTTLYAVYRSVELYTVQFMSYFGNQIGYAKVASAGGRVLEGKTINSYMLPREIENRYKVGDDGLIEVIYKFDHWTTDGPSGLNIKTQGVPFDIENEVITKNTTLYAVYRSEEFYTVQFMAYFGNQTGYAQITSAGGKVAKGGTIDYSMQPRSVDDYVVLGADGLVEKIYEFDHWTTEEPSGVNDIKETGREFDFNTEITKNTTLYAVYEEHNTPAFTVTFKVYDADLQDYVVAGERTVRDGKLFSDIVKPDVQEFVEITESNVPTKYAFRDKWTASEPEEGRIIDSTTNEYTNTRIEEDLTLYAIYGKTKEVQFWTWHGDTDHARYTNPSDYVLDVIKGEKIDKNNPSLPQPQNVLSDNIEYKFDYWTDTSPTDGILKNTEDSRPAKFDFDAEEINDDTTLYAVYGSIL